MTEEVYCGKCVYHVLSDNSNSKHDCYANASVYRKVVHQSPIGYWTESEFFGIDDCMEKNKNNDCKFFKNRLFPKYLE